MDCILKTVRRFEDWLSTGYVTVQQGKNGREEWLARSDDLTCTALLTAGEIAREGTRLGSSHGLGHGALRSDARRMRRFRDKIRALREEAVNEPVTTEAMDGYVKAAEDARMHYQAELSAEAVGGRSPLVPHPWRCAVAPGRPSSRRTPRSFARPRG